MKRRVSTQKNIWSTRISLSLCRTSITHLFETIRGGVSQRKTETQHRVDFLLLLKNIGYTHTFER